MVEGPNPEPHPCAGSERPCAGSDRSTAPAGVASLHYPLARRYFNNFASSRLPPVPRPCGRAKTARGECPGSAAGALPGPLFTTAGAIARGPRVKHKDRLKTRLFGPMNCASLSTASFEMNCAASTSRKEAARATTASRCNPDRCTKPPPDCPGTLAKSGAGRVVRWLRLTCDDRRPEHR